MNYGRSSYFGGGTGVIPPMVRNLIVINVVVFLLQQLTESLFGIIQLQVGGQIVTGTPADVFFGLVPTAVWHGLIWQVFTYMFLHGGFMHILFNMFVLWMFGRILEQVWGPRKFLVYYLICGLGAGIINAAIMPHSTIPTIGASAAIYGLLLAFGLLFPNQLIFIYFLFPIKAKYFVMIMVVIEFFSGFNPASPVAHFAHLAGMGVGFVYLMWPRWRHKVKVVKEETEREKRLKVVYSRREEIERLQKEVDDLLDKINREGLDSLSVGDKQRLKEASRKLKEWEEKGWQAN